MPQREHWETIPGYEGIYEVSDQGRVRSLDRVIPHKRTKTRTIKGRILSPAIANTGYSQVTLWKNFKGQNKQLHVLVTETFLGPRPNGLEVCHNNGNKQDNRLENLRYDTRSANALDRTKHGHNHLRNRTHCPRGHELKAPNLVKSKHAGNRACLACSRAYHYMRYHKIPQSELQRISDNYFKKLIDENLTAPKD